MTAILHLLVSDALHKRDEATALVVRTDDAHHAAVGAQARAYEAIAAAIVVRSGEIGPLIASYNAARDATATTLAAVVAAQSAERAADAVWWGAHLEYQAHVKYEALPGGLPVNNRTGPVGPPPFPEPRSDGRTETGMNPENPVNLIVERLIAVGRWKLADSLTDCEPCRILDAMWHEDTELITGILAETVRIDPAEFSAKLWESIGVRGHRTMAMFLDGPVEVTIRELCVMAYFPGWPYVPVP